jgi:hypothetical protein
MIKNVFEKIAIILIAELDRVVVPIVVRVVFHVVTFVVITDLGVVSVCPC